MVQQTHARQNGAGPWAGASVPDSVTRVAVDVTFLRMVVRPDEAAPALPPDCTIVHVPAPTVGFYRYLYGAVGHDYCWWLRRAASDGELTSLLANPRIRLHVLYRGGEPGGFFELDGRLAGEVNISYFGLMPHQIGKGIGVAFLRAAVDAAWAQAEAQFGAQAVGIRVNTCTADHPRALGSYLRVGFKPVRTVREIWNIPDHLGLPIPPHLRA